MLSGESSISHRVPFKDCKNFTINHNLVIIHLSLEWPDKAGDNPNLVLDIIDKKTPAKPDQNETLMSYFQQNPNPLSVRGSSTVHYHPENIIPTYPQQQQHYFHYPSAINNTDPSSSTGDHNDVSSTTTNVPFNTIQPQSSAVYLRPPILLNQQYLPSQHVIQTSPSFINDPRSIMQMSINSSISSTKHTSSIPSHVDLQQQQQPPLMTYPSLTTSATSPLKYLVCSCLKPHIAHDFNCPAAPLTSQQSILTMPSEMINQPSSDRKLSQQVPMTSQPRLNGAISLLSMKEPGQTTLLPFPNPNLMITSNVPVTNLQQLQHTHNNALGLTIKVPRIDHDNSFQQPLNSSPIIINNPPNFQSNSLVKKPTGKPRNIAPSKSRTRKNGPIKQNSLPNQEQTSFPNLNNSPQQGYFLNGFNSPEKQQQQQSTTPPSHLTSPIQLQQGTFIFNDNTPVVTSVPSGITLISSPNDMNGNNTQQQQPSPRMNRMVRSPVKLDISSPLQNSTQTTVSPAQIEQTINDVVEGRGKISVNNTPTSADPQQSSSSLQLVWETTGRVTTKTYLSPLHQKQQSMYDPNTSTIAHQDVISLAQRVATPNTTEQNTTSKQQTASTNKKRNRSKPAANTGSNHNCNKKPTITIKPSSQQDKSETTSTIISPTPNSINKPISWSSTTPIPSSPRFVTTTTKKLTDTSTGNLTQHSTSFDKNDSWLPSGVDNNSALIDSFQLDSANEHEHQIPLHHSYDYIFTDDEFSSKPDDQFHSSTPPPLSLSPALTGNQLFPSLLTEKTSSTAPNNIYNYFLPNSSSSQTTWGENQVTSSVLTPPDPQHNHFPQQQQQQQQQYNSSIDEQFDLFPQSQTPTSQIIAPTSNRYNQMNNNDIKTSSFSSSDHQPKQQSSQKLTQQQSTKSLKHSSKLSRQQTRSNPIQKQQNLTKPTCTRCGLTQLIDITHHEFPKQKGLVFECMSCGNSSIRSNVSDNEHRRRLAMVAADHLNIVECQFCHTRFNTHNDYLMHLRNDHASNKPM